MRQKIKTTPEKFIRDHLGLRTFTYIIHKNFDVYMIIALFVTILFGGPYNYMHAQLAVLLPNLTI